MLPYQQYQKPRSSTIGKSSSGSSLDILLGKKFWLEDKQQHKQEFIRTNGQCCFNHCIGLPVKDKEHLMYDYEINLFNKLFSINEDFKDKHLWILKSTGLGITELFLRIIASMYQRQFNERFTGLYCYWTQYFISSYID